MCGMNKVCRLPNHGAIDPSPPFRLWLLCNAATETNPELSHSEANEEAAAVSSLCSDVSTPVFLFRVTRTTNTRRKLMTDTGQWLLGGKPLARKVLSHFRAPHTCRWRPVYRRKTRPSKLIAKGGKKPGTVITVTSHNFRFKALLLPR